jgi:hypothetical protein
LLAKRDVRAPEIGTLSVCPWTSMRCVGSWSFPATLRSTASPRGSSDADPDGNRISWGRFSRMPSRSCSIWI